MMIAGKSLCGSKLCMNDCDMSMTYVLLYSENVGRRTTVLYTHQSADRCRTSKWNATQTGSWWVL